MRRLLSEPLIWFVIVAVALFVLDANITRQAKIIRADRGVVNHIAALWQAQMQKPPTQAQLQSLLDNWIQEERFVREALRLGLDEKDTIVRRRLVQKYKFLLAQVDNAAPTDESLRAYYENNIDQYLLPNRLTFSQILLSDPESAETVLSALDGLENWRALSQPTLLPSSYLAKTRAEVGFALGDAFAAALFDAPQKQGWFGPLTSVYGDHLVKIDAYIPENAAPLETIVDKVRYDLTRDQTAEHVAVQAKKLESEYPVVYE